METDQNQRRPRGILLIVILIIITGVWFIIAGIAVTLLTPATVVTTIEGTPVTEELAPVTGIVAMAVVLNFIGVAHLGIASGMLKRKKWSWKGAVALSIISMVISIAMIVLAGNIGTIVNILIAAAIMYYLNMHNARQYFGMVEN